MAVRGHNLVWPGWEYLPDDLYTRRNDPDYISELGLQSTGRHAIELDARRFSSGTYVYRLAAGEHHHTGYMSVLR